MKLGVVIARQQDVFAVLSDVRNVPRWSRNTIEETLITLWTWEGPEQPVRPPGPGTDWIHRGFDEADG